MRSRRLGGVVVAIALAAAALPEGGFVGDRMARVALADPVGGGPLGIL